MLMKDVIFVFFVKPWSLRRWYIKGFGSCCDQEVHRILFVDIDIVQPRPAMALRKFIEMDGICL